jgi:uncharacterized phosphosugar-binding protein
MGLAADYLTALEANIEAVARQERDGLRAAADMIVEAQRGGRKAYEYLAGHLMPIEAAVGRRGRPEVLLSLKDGETDRLEPGDVLVMTHQYGVHESYVNVAIAAKARGARIIAIAPPSDPARIVRSHPTGTWVGDYAERVISTHIPEGDVALTAPEGGPGSCPTSGAIQALMHWMLVCELAERHALNPTGG